jgi:WD40 repeat protein
MTCSNKSSLTPQQIKRYTARLLGEQFRPLLPRTWQQQRSIRKLATDGTPNAVAGLADGLVANCFQSAALRTEAIVLFEPLVSRLQNVESINALCRDWMEHGEAAALHAEAIVPLAIRLQSVETLDELCRYWIESRELDVPLMHLLLDAGHAPSDPAQRAIFWLLGGKIQRYDELDLDGSLLTQAHANASPTLRKRLATAAAAAGRMEWSGAMEVAKPLSAFSEEDWSATVQLLKRAGDAKALWQWALKAPPIYSRSLLQEIPVATPPPAQFGEGVIGLQRHARELPPIGDESQLRPDHCTNSLSTEPHSFIKIAWSPDGRCLASGGHDNNSIRLWDPVSGTCTRTLSGHRERVSSVSWSPDGRCLAVKYGPLIRFWDPDTSNYTEHSFGSNLIAWSPDGRCLDYGSNRIIGLWDSASRVVYNRLSGYRHRAYAVRWSPDGRYLASGGNEGVEVNIKLWDLASGACIHTFAGHAHGDPFEWSPDGRCLAAGKYNDRSIRLWFPASGAFIRTLRGHMGSVESIAWSPDGRCLASCGWDKTIRLWDPASHVCTHTLSGHSGCVHLLAWSPDGRCLASGGHNDSNIRLWDPASGACTRTLSGHWKSSFSIAWSPDGRYLASSVIGMGGELRVQLWANGFSSLLTMPLACYGVEQWDLLSNLQKKSLRLEAWQRSWLEFIDALSSSMRRFDVSIYNQSSKPASSKFEIEIDG